MTAGFTAEKERSRRLSSLEGFFEENVSANLINFKSQGEHFLECLDGYIANLHSNSNSISRRIDQTGNFPQE